MKTREKSRSNRTSIVWERAEPDNRPAPEPLSREKILRAAIAIADQEGLASVSLRKVGAALGAGPMRLYGYIATKEELFELMVDEVFGEMLPKKAAKVDWRQSLKAIAQRTRRAATTHKWLVDLLGGRPHLGPNALAYLEHSLSAFANAPGFKDIDDVMQAGKTFNAYVIGAIRSEASERCAEDESGLDKGAWQAASEPYIRRMIDTGRFPTLAKVVRDAANPPFDAVFDKGLDCVLDGIEAQLSS